MERLGLVQAPLSVPDEAASGSRGCDRWSPARGPNGSPYVAVTMHHRLPGENQWVAYGGKYSLPKEFSGYVTYPKAPSSLRKGVGGWVWRFQIPFESRMNLEP